MQKGKQAWPTKRSKSSLSTRFSSLFRAGKNDCDSLAQSAAAGDPSTPEANVPDAEPRRAMPRARSGRHWTGGVPGLQSATSAPSLGDLPSVTSTGSLSGTRSTSLRRMRARAAGSAGAPPANGDVGAPPPSQRGARRKRSIRRKIRRSPSVPDADAGATTTPAGRAGAPTGILRSPSLPGQQSDRKPKPLQSTAPPTSILRSPSAPDAAAGLDEEEEQLAPAGDAVMRSRSAHASAGSRGRPASLRRPAPPTRAPPPPPVPVTRSRRSRRAHSPPPPPLAGGDDDFVDCLPSDSESFGPGAMTCAAVCASTPAPVSPNSPQALSPVPSAATLVPSVRTIPAAPVVPAVSTIPAPAAPTPPGPDPEEIAAGRVADAHARVSARERALLARVRARLSTEADAGALGQLHDLQASLVALLDDRAVAAASWDATIAQAESRLARIDAPPPPPQPTRTPSRVMFADAPPLSDANSDASDVDDRHVRFAETPGKAVPTSPIVAPALITDIPDVSDVIAAKKADGGRLCVICREGFKPGQRVMSLPCFHFFHEACLAPYLDAADEPVCPIDRQPVPKEDILYLPVWRWGDKVRAGFEGGE